MFEVSKILLRLGCLGFGGPFALIAMLEEEFVFKRQWVSSEKFNSAFAIIKVFPGATASQLAIYLAREKLGTFGGFVGGVVFILPSALFVLLLSIFYVRAHEVPQMSSLFQGMQIGALVVIADSVSRMAKPYLKVPRAIFISLVSGVVIFAKPEAEPFLILGFGIIGVYLASNKINQLAGAFFGAASIKGQIASSTTFKLAVICLKTGFLVFGTGLAIIPVLEADVVQKYHWLTHGEFLDGLAIGQITPGPVSTTATFIGYKVAGLSGAFWATIAIFTSSFFNMLVILPQIESRLKGSPKLKSFTDWAFPAVIGGIAATSFRLAYTTVNSWLLLICLVSIALVALKWKSPAWALIPGSGLAIWIAHRLTS